MVLIYSINKFNKLLTRESKTIPYICNTMINNLDLTVRTENVLFYLGIFDIKQLQSATFPAIGTVVYRVPIANVRVVYTSKVDNEIKELLKELSDETKV
jgi:hypothetical protein